MRLLVLQHIACEHPGVFTEVMRERGVEPVAVELDEGEPLPDWREFDAVLAMGGPMGAGDDAEHPWLAAGAAAGARGGRGRPARSSASASGVQLLAAALGARVYAAERPEVGLLEVELTDEGRADPLFAGLDDRSSRCNGTATPSTCPPGAVRLARSPAAANQAFRSGERAYGVQFHLEVTAEMAREWATIPAYRESLAETLGRGRRRGLHRRRSSGAPASLHPPARRLFSNWLDACRSPGVGACPAALYNFVH